MVNVPEWKNTTLGNEVDFLTGFPFKSEQYLTDISQPKLLRGDNIVQGQLRWDNSKHWHKDKIAGLEQYLLQPNDVVLAMDRPWIEAGLKFSSITENDIPSLLVQRVSRLRGTETILSRFIKYVIGDKRFTDYVLGIQTGTAVPHISSKQIKDYKFFLPPLPEQQVIVGVLGALDDKINLNQRMNETLEGIAQELFKSWFVDFDPVNAKAEGREPEGLSDDLAALFPNNFEDDRPKGWSEESLYSCAEYINGAAYKDMHFSDAEDALPVIKIAELKNGVGQGTKRTNTDLGENYLINTGEILFSWSGSPETSIDTFLWVGGAAWLNQHIFKVVTLSPETRPFIFFLLKHLKPVFVATAKNKQTTGLGHVTVQDLKRLKIVYPSIEVLRAFAEIVTPILERLQHNLEQIALLSGLRDELLPRLISGKLRVNEVSEIVAAVTS